jgi:hypothetical protein
MNFSLKKQYYNNNETQQLLGVLLAAALPLLEVKILVLQFVGWSAIQFIKKQADISKAAHDTLSIVSALKPV